MSIREIATSGLSFAWPVVYSDKAVPAADRKTKTCRQRLTFLSFRPMVPRWNGREPQWFDGRGEPGTAIVATVTIVRSARGDDA